MKIGGGEGGRHGKGDGGKKLLRRKKKKKKQNPSAIQNNPEIPGRASWKK